MGTLYIGDCNCGFKTKPVYHGTGLCNPNAEDSDPDIHIVCLGCRSIFQSPFGKAATAICSLCGSTDILPTMRKERPGTEGSQVEPIEGLFPCPGCKRWMLSIGKGQWD
jgi:LSD1 subclass zinc finger protein